MKELEKTIKIPKTKLLVLHLKEGHHENILKQKPFYLTHDDLISIDAPHKVELKVYPKVYSRFRKAIKQKKGMKFLKSDFIGGKINFEELSKNIVNTATTIKNGIKNHVPKEAVKLAISGIASSISPETAPINAVLANTATNMIYGTGDNTPNIKMKIKKISSKKSCDDNNVLQGLPVKIGSFEIPLSNPSLKKRKYFKKKI